MSSDDARQDSLQSQGGETVAETDALTPEADSVAAEQNVIVEDRRRRLVGALRRFWTKMVGLLTRRTLSREEQAPQDHHITIRGAVHRIQDDELNDPVFNARVTHRTTNVLDTTDEDGQFELRILRSQLLRDPYIWILPPATSHAFYPRRVGISNPELSVELQKGDTALVPIVLPEPLKRVPGAVWGIGSVVEAWCIGGLVKRLMMCLVLPVLGVVAIDAGTPVPFTDYDDHLRELLQRTPYYPSFRPEVTFSVVRSVYHTGIEYRLRSGEYVCGPEGILIEDGAKLTIEPGTTLSLPQGASVHVSGQLDATGETDRKILFRRAGGDRWNNIVFEGHNSSKSVLRHCEIVGGGGTPSRASDTGFFELVESGSPIGGGILIYDTSIQVAHTLIRDCHARFGGAIYMRNPPTVGDPTHGQLPGSHFEDVTFENCLTDDDVRAGGSAVFVKSAYPEFESCHFKGNQTHGKYSCGGAVYVGEEARAKFSKCDFDANVADAEGGGLYLYRCASRGDENTSGVVLLECTFTNNTAHGSGGGISAFDSRVRLDSVTFSRNTAFDYNYSTGRRAATGGGCFLDFSSRFVRAARQNDQSPTVLTGCEFVENRSDFSRVPDLELSASEDRGDFAGGGLYIRSAIRGLPVSTDKLTFRGNNAANGTDAAVPDWMEIPESWEFVGLADEAQLAKRLFKQRELKPWWTEPVALDSRFLLPQNCYSERDPGREIDTVVLHHISAVNVVPNAPYDVENVVRIFRAEYQGVTETTSSHYLIARDGTVYLLVPDEKKAWHAGKSAMPIRTDGGTEVDREDVNQFSIGIELVKRVDDPITEEQFESLVRLMLQLKRAHSGIELKNVVGHDAIRAYWNLRHPDERAAVKDDPGPMFDWARLYATLAEAEF